MSLTWAEFIAIPNGTQVLNHNFDQCVAVANHYNENVLGNGFVAVGSAFQWWTLRSSNGVLASNFVASSVPVPGALFIGLGGIFNSKDGHIGVVTAVGAGGSFDTMEQNTGEFAPQRYLYRYTRNVSDAGLLGFLVPTNNPATPTPIEEIDMSVMTFITDNTAGTWWVTDGLHRRSLASGENQLLIDLGLVEAVDKPGGVHVITTAQLTRIPIAV